MAKTSFLAIVNRCDLNEIRCDPNSQRNLFRTKNLVNKAERATSSIRMITVIDSGVVPRPCEPNLRIDGAANL